MKGKKPELNNVIPMKGVQSRPVPPAPDLMSDGARRVWDDLAPDMIRAGRLEPRYEHMFAVVCCAINDVMELQTCIDLEGRTYTVKTRNGLQQKKTASWQAQLDALATLRQFGALFGMSPVDDKRLVNPDQGDLFKELKAMLNEPV